MRKGICVLAAAVITVSLFFLVNPSYCLADRLTVSAHRDSSYRPDEPGKWAVSMTFNHRIFQSNLSDAITATRNGTRTSVVVEAIDRGDQASRRFRIVGTVTEYQGTPITITVKQGLSDATGRLLLEKDFTYELLAIERVSLTSWTTFFKSSTNKGINLNLSRTIPDRELSRAIRITPEVPGLRVSRRGRTGYSITGDFVFQQDYVLQVSEAKVQEEKYLLEAQEVSFKGPGLRPAIAPRTDRTVVELRGRQLFPLTLTNVSKVRCKLVSIPPYLAPEYLSENPSGETRRAGRRGARGSKEAQAPPKAPGNIRGVSPAFLSQSEERSEAFFSPDAKDHVLGYSLPLTFRENPERGGVWMAVFSDPDGNVQGETWRVIQITDLSIGYKISAKNLLLWVTSIHTGQPVRNAQAFVSDEDGFRYLVGKTDKDGTILLEDGRSFPAIGPGQESADVSDRPIPMAKLTWAVAATDADASAVELRGERLKPFAINQVEKLDEKRHPRTAYIFTERGIYRPGETVQFKFFARAYEDHKIVSPTDDPVKVTITNPRQDVLYSKELKLTEFGTCHDSFHVEKFFASGTYTMNATVGKGGGQSASCSRTFLVQEFKQPRHFVTLTLKPGERPAKEYVGVQRKDDFLSVDVRSQYYTGGPVKHAKVRWKAMLKPVTHKVEGLDAYMFGNEDSQTLFLESGESLTDGNGELNVSIPLDNRLLTGIYGVNISATVLDIDGEPATEVSTYQPKPRYLVGISKHPTQVQNGYAAPLRLAVVGRDGKKVSQGTVEACIMQKKHFYTQKRDDAGNVNYLWEEGWMKGLSSRIPVKNGEAVFDIQLNDFGNYLVSFTFEDKTGKYTSQTSFKVGWEQYDEWVRQRSDKEVRTTSEVLLSTAKEEFKIGEQVRVSFHLPRPVSKCLVALEKGQTLEYRLIDVNGTDGTYEFTAKEAFQPNVFVSIMAAAGRQDYPVYASQVDTDIPTVFYGYTDVTVRNDTKKFHVEIEPGVGELKARPAEPKSLSFKVTDNRNRGVPAELAICVVDEAVLALTGFKTPELTSLADFNLPLAVFSGDLRSALVSQDLFRILSTRPLSGGGMGLGETAASLKIRKDFRPVAYFNPSIVTDASGKVSVNFTLPDSTTAYRIYAVACDKGSGFASAQRNMVVTKEFFLEPSTPRFLIPGDRVTFPISVNNKTAEKGQATLEAESSQDIKLEPKRMQAEVPPRSASVLHATAEALGGADTATIRFKANFSGASQNYGDAIEQTFPMHSRYLPLNRAIVGGFSTRAEVPVNLPEILKTLKPHEIASADFKAHVGLSTGQWTRIAPGLTYLLRYPYGCVEQTSSGVIPLAGLRGLVQAGKVPGVTKERVDEFLRSGVERLLSMQVPSGGFAYWPGSTDPSWWGTMYATFALTSAKEAGYAVPGKALRAALQYLHDNLFKKRGGDIYHGQDWTREYALINLARGDMLSSAELASFFEKFEELSPQGKALLLLTAKKLSYMPDEKIREMLEKLDPRINPAHSAYYNSSVRQIAVCLMAAAATGSKAKADSWAAQLMESVKPDGRWNSTADTGWALLALGDYFKQQKTGEAMTVMVRIQVGDDKPIEAKVTDASAQVALPMDTLLKTGKIVLQSDSDTLVNYTISLTYPDMVTDPSALEKGFVLQKTMENLNGNKEIRVGDIVRVTLEFGPPGRNRWEHGPLEYLVLEDPVPAGLVPINSELKTEGVEEKKRSDEAPSWRDGYDMLEPSYVEFRDDGVRVFKNRLWPYRHRYTYLARAVAPGQFWMRASRVSLMYDPEQFGKTTGRQVTVLPAGK